VLIGSQSSKPTAKYVSWKSESYPHGRWQAFKLSSLQTASRAETSSFKLKMNAMDQLGFLREYPHNSKWEYNRIECQEGMLSFMTRSKAFAVATPPRIYGWVDTILYLQIKQQKR
jgi:hypothetical protein